MTKHSLLYPLLAGALFLCTQSIHAESLVSPETDSQEAIDQNPALNLDDSSDNFYGYGGYGLGYSSFDYGYALRYLCLYYPYMPTCGGFGPFFGDFDGGWWGGRGGRGHGGRHHRHNHH